MEPHVWNMRVELLSLGIGPSVGPLGFSKHSLRTSLLEGRPVTDEDVGGWLCLF